MVRVCVYLLDDDMGEKEGEEEGGNGLRGSSLVKALVAH